MSELSRSSERDNVAVPSAETIFSFMQEMSDVNPVSYSVPQVEGWKQSFISYGLPVPPYRVPDVGYDRIHIYVKSPSASYYQEALKNPGHPVGGIGLHAMDDFHPIELSKDLAKQYYIVPKNSEGHLTIVKEISEEETGTVQTVIEPEKPTLRRKLLGRLGLHDHTVELPASSITEVAGKPVAEAQPEEVVRLYQLMQEGVHYREATSTE